MEKKSIRFDSKLYRHIVYIPMLNVFLVADLILFCHERDFVLSLSEADVIETFDTTARYLDDLLNIDNHLIENFEQMVIQIYPHSSSVK